MIKLLQLFFLVIILAPKLTFSAVCTTISAGDFSDDAIWSCGSAPSRSDIITINHNVNLDVDFTGGGGRLTGTLTVSVGASLASVANSIEVGGTGTLSVNGTFAVNNIEFLNGSNITFSSTSAVTIHGDFTNNNNSTNVTINSPITVNGNLDNGNGAVIAGTGTIDVGGTVTNDGSGTILGCTGVACGCGDCVLAIELVDFRLSREGNDVKIEWTTASEINNSHFVVQRSYDGLTFHELTKIAGAGNSNIINKYYYIDTPGESVVYYRIVDHDHDGLRTYHEIKFITVGGANNTKLNVICFGHEILISGSNTQNNLLSVYDVSGNLVGSGIVNQDNAKYEINGANAHGMYIVRIYNSQTAALLFNGKIILAN